MYEPIQINDPQYTKDDKICPLCGGVLEIIDESYYCEDCDYREEIEENPNIIL